MLKFMEWWTNLFIIFIIFIRIPEENIGLDTSTTLGSPNSSKQFLNILTTILISIDFLIAIQLNTLNS